MRIECPICSTGLNVDDSQIGTKGRCPKCETKFIIPSDPDDDIEVLEEGEVASPKKKSRDERERDEPKPEKRKKKSRSSERDDERDERRRRKPEKRERRERVDDDGGDDDLVDAGGVGKALGLLALGLILGLVIGFALGRITAGGGDGDGSGVEAAGDTKDPFGLSESN